MADTLATSTPQGELRYVGKVHGALNFHVMWYDDPEDWQFKQFVSQEQLEKFAAENNLTIVMESNQ